MAGSDEERNAEVDPHPVVLILRSTASTRYLSGKCQYSYVRLLYGRFVRGTASSDNARAGGSRSALGEVDSSLSLLRLLKALNCQDQE